MSPQELAEKTGTLLADLQPGQPRDDGTMTPFYGWAVRGLGGAVRLVEVYAPPGHDWELHWRELLRHHVGRLQAVLDRLDKFQ